MNTLLKPITKHTTEYQTEDIWRFLLHNALNDRKRSKWTNDEKVYEMNREKARQVGAIHIAFSKESLAVGHSIPVTTFESLSSLEDKITHWTPQIYMWGRKNNKGRNQQNIRFLTTAGVETDEEVTVEEIHYASAMAGLPSPALILETPRGGKQWFYVFSKPFAGSVKARRAGRGIATEIRAAFSEYLPVDPFANPTGYFRFPTKENTLYFKEETLDSEWALTWYKQNMKTTVTKIKPKKQNQLNTGHKYVNSACVQAILENLHMEGSKAKIGRNNSVFTLGLAFKADGFPFEHTYNAIDEWNSNLVAGIENKELFKTLKSAYDSDFKAPSRFYLEALSGINMKYNGRYITPPKPREERERSHYSEWEVDIVNYLEEHCSPEKPFLCGSQRSIASAIGEFAIGKKMGKNSLMDVLKASKLFVVKMKEKNGRILKGRGACLYIASRKMILASNKLTFKRFLVASDKTNIENSSIGFSVDLNAKKTGKMTQTPSPFEDDSGG